MDLGYELSKFKRNDVEIIAYLSSVLEVPLNGVFTSVHEDSDLKLLLDSYNEAKSLGVVSYLQGKLLLADLDTHKLLVVLPNTIEEEFQKSMDESCKEYDSTVANLQNNVINDFLYPSSHKVLVLNYDNMIYMDFHYNKLVLDYKYICSIRNMIFSDIDFELINVIRDCNLTLPFAEYIFNRDSYFNKLLNYINDALVNERLHCSSNTDYIQELNESNYIISDRLANPRPSELVSLTCCNMAEYDIEFAGYDIFDNNIYTSSRSNILCQWLLLYNTPSLGFKSITFKSNIPIDVFQEYYNAPLDCVCYNISGGTINTAKDLPRLLANVCVQRYHLPPSIISLRAPKYFSVIADKFKRPMSLSDYGLYADGNLSVKRAVTKFINAVEELGLNLTDFELIIK